jgi:hypothetical protein
MKKRTMMRKARNAVVLAVLPFAVTLFGVAIIVTMTYEFMRMVMQYAMRDTNASTDKYHGPMS